MAVARQIVGPQEQFERTGAQSLRDIRPFTTRLSEGLRSSASGLVLAICAGVAFFEPGEGDRTHRDSEANDGQSRLRLAALSLASFNRSPNA